MNRMETIKLLRVARTVWPDLPASEDAITAWCWAFEDMSYPDVEAALAIHIRTSPFAPKPADLRKPIAETVAGEPWEAAWDELMATVRRYGIYWADDRFTKRDWAGWSSPDVEAAVRHIGYREVCMADTDQLGILRAQFRDGYRSGQQRRVRDVQTGAKDLVTALRERSGAERSEPRGTGEPAAIADIVGRMAGTMSGRGKA